jgi:Helix-turn-helix domain
MNSTSMHFEPADDDKANQSIVVLSALRQRPQSTIDLRALHVMSPAARVMDLRRKGLQIETKRTGRCAVYALREVSA